LWCFRVRESLLSAIQRYKKRRNVVCMSLYLSSLFSLLSLFLFLSPCLLFSLLLLSLLLFSSPLFYLRSLCLSSLLSPLSLSMPLLTKLPFFPSPFLPSPRLSLNQNKKLSMTPWRTLFLLLLLLLPWLLDLPYLNDRSIHRTNCAPCCRTRLGRLLSSLSPLLARLSPNRLVPWVLRCRD